MDPEKNFLGQGKSLLTSPFTLNLALTIPPATRAQCRAALTHWTLQCKALVQESNGDIFRQIFGARNQIAIFLDKFFRAAAVTRKNAGPSSDVDNA